MELGKELGQYNEIIESNKWLKGLQALAKGDEEVEPEQVRVILMTVTKAALSWLDLHTEDTSVFWRIRPTVNQLSGNLEQWKV